MRVFFIIILSACLCTSGLCGSVAKVGSGRAFLTISPSIRANGMGEAGVALAGHEAGFFNPAGLAFVDTGRYMRLFFYPRKTEMLFDAFHFNHLSLSGAVLADYRAAGAIWNLNLAYARTSLISDPIAETTYEFPEGTGRFFRIKHVSHAVTIGAGVSSTVDVGGGFSVKWYSDEMFQVESDGHAFDYGLFVRMPLSRLVAESQAGGGLTWDLIPAAGASWQNYGPDVANELYTYSLPKTRRVGFAVTGIVSKQLSGGETSLLELTPAHEHETPLAYADPSYDKIGVEAGVMGAATLRLGRVRTDDLLYRKSWGFGLKSTGIVGILTMLIAPGSETSGPVVRFLRHRLHVEFEYADVTVLPDTALEEKDTFYGIRISL